MLVKEAMHKQAHFLPPEARLADVADEMKNNDFGFMPIGDNDRIVGVCTDRDLVIEGLINGKEPDKLCAKDVMTKKVLYCFEEDDIKDAVKSMEDQKIRRLIVLDKGKRMTGILSMGDIARKSHDDQLCGELIEGVSEEE